METPDDIKQAMKRAFAKDWAARIDEFTDQFKIDLAYGQDLGMIPTKMIEHVQQTMDNLNKMRAKLDEWTSDIQDLVTNGKVQSLGILANEVAEIASQAIAIAMGNASDNPTVDQLAEQLSTDLDFMNALKHTENYNAMACQRSYEAAAHWLGEYAIYKNGERHIGCQERNLKDVLKEVRKFYELD